MKRIIYLFTGLSAFFLMFFACTQKTSAISFNLENAQKIVWDPVETIATNNVESKRVAIRVSKEVAYLKTWELDGFAPKYFQLGVKNELKKGQIVALNYSFAVKANAYQDYYFSVGNYYGISCDTKCFVLDQTVNSSGIDSYGTIVSPNLTSYQSHYNGTVWLQILEPVQKDAITLIVENIEEFYVRGGVIADSIDVNVTMSNIDKNIQEGNQAEQERYEEGKNEADQSKNDSQSSSEDSQKQADEASVSLFEIINSLKDAVIESKPGNCNISGDFGFFNAGNIDICTGGAAFRPITNVVGAVMLVFFSFGSALVLAKTFLRMYNNNLGG